MNGVLDDIIGGLENGDVIVIGARPAVGKSAFVTQIALHLAGNKKKVAFYNLEMSEKQVYERLVSAVSGIGLTRIRRAHSFLGDEKERFDRAENQFNSYKNQPGNLWRSIENYRIAMKRYEVFADKPQEWRIARERFTKAQAILDRIRLDGSARVNLLYQQRELRNAIEECNRLMEFFPETSKTYQKIRQNKLRFESIIAGDKK